MDLVLEALADQHAELAALLGPLDAAGWAQASPCEGWDVADVVVHLAQTDELARGSVEGRFDAVIEELTMGAAFADSVDAGAQSMVERDRAAGAAVIHERWTHASDALRAALATADPHARVAWVAGRLSVRTLATTRLAECWIHTTDVATALGVDVAPTDRLHDVARLAWRTLPYAFALAGASLAGPVAFDLRGPSGVPWAFVPDDPPATVIRGDGVELCRVAARRIEPAATGLTGTGPDVDAVLSLVRTYA